MPKKPITIADIVRVFGECELLDERGIFLPIHTVKKEHDYNFPLEKWRTPDWKADKAFGDDGEKWIEYTFENSDGKTEIKTERDDGTCNPKQWKISGNIAIEYADGNNKLKGLWKTDASIWIHSLSEKHGKGYKPVQSYIFYDIPKLRIFIKWLVDEKIKTDEGKFARIPSSRPDNAKIVVVPIKLLEKYNDFT